MWATMCDDKLGLGKHEEPVGVAGTGDPHLIAVDDPVIALLYGRGLPTIGISDNTYLTDQYQRCTWTPATSDPAPGSVTQYAAMSGCSHMLHENYNILRIFDS